MLSSVFIVTGLWHDWSKGTVGRGSGGGARAGAIGSEVWTDDYHPFWRNHRRKWVGLRKTNNMGGASSNFLDLCMRNGRESVGEALPMGE